MKKSTIIFLSILAGVIIVAGLTALIVLSTDSTPGNSAAASTSADASAVELISESSPVMASQSTAKVTENEEASSSVTKTEPEKETKETTPPTSEKTESTEKTEPTENNRTNETTKPTEPPHSHSYTSTVVNATCTQKGYTKFTCSCGKSYTDNYTDALGHSYTETVVEPTTSSEGYTEHTCSRCGNSYKDNYTEKLKVVYDYALVQQIGNNYIASLGYVVDPSLPYGVCGYYPAEILSGLGISLCGGQEFFNNRVIENVVVTINRLLATEPDGDITGYRLFCSVTYDESSDAYTVCVYYG